MSNESISTPQSGRRPRLGLVRRACLSTPLLKLQKAETDTKTPSGIVQNATPKTFPLSMSARRVGLSKHRTELSKKRLEFAVMHDLTEQEGSVSEGKEKACPKSEEKKPDRKKRKVREDTKKAKDEEKEEAEKEQIPSKTLSEDVPKSSKIVELQGDIEIWRKGFIASVEDLQSMVDPKPTKSDLMVQLGIPLEMLRYLEEE
ncbi:uncharacterized protein AH6.3 [Drosophila bipectinata]|uniref:uncharacterized protein AH6.3 n=1 Tax=Drosophila bipectinata TaxID=42026 RepID=UPI001C898FED|nr:uncharacterized protein LOC108121836 [Drosophila bipectinata]